MSYRSSLVGRSRTHLVGAGAWGGNSPSFQDRMQYVGDDPGTGAPLYAPCDHPAIAADRGMPVAYARDGRLTAVETQPDEAREMPIGFNYAGVPASATVDVETKPQMLFRGERFMIDDLVQGTLPTYNLFDIKQVAVGTVSQFAANGSLMGSAFRPDAVGSRMQLDTAEPGILVVVTVTNLDAANPRNFRGVMFGSVLR